MSKGGAFKPGSNSTQQLPGNQFFSQTQGNPWQGFQFQPGQGGMGGQGQWGAGGTGWPGGGQSAGHAAPPPFQPGWMPPGQTGQPPESVYSGPGHGVHPEHSMQGSGILQGLVSRLQPFAQGQAFPFQNLMTSRFPQLAERFPQVGNKLGSIWDRLQGPGPAATPQQGTM